MTFALEVPFLTRWQHGDNVLVVDAGGGTIDISSYAVTNNRPLQVEELFQPKCEPVHLSLAPCSIIEIPLQGLFQGGEFVTARASEMVSGGFKCTPSHSLFSRNQKS